MARARPPSSPERAEPLPVRHLVLGTLSFGVCFAAWGLISAFAPAFRQSLGLSGTQTALLVAAPVLLGAIARIPMGIASDRFGARAVFADRFSDPLNDFRDVILAVATKPTY